MWRIVVFAQTFLKGGKVDLLNFPIALGAEEGCRRSQAGDTSCLRPHLGGAVVANILQSSGLGDGPLDKAPTKKGMTGLRCVRVRLWGVCELKSISEKW